VRYLSVCSGIEAATVAWHSLGWEAAAFAEIEAFPAAVLAHHYPAVPNYGDMTKHKEWDLGAIDLLVGGTPCQSFSVAGLRKGLDDPRGNLMLTYLAIADQRRPRWLVWENVPGVLSSNGGKDFGTFLGALAELGYGFAYRVLDAQYFGVAQRRRRVFVVGYLGDWRPAAAVLFEPESLRGDSAPSREKGKEVASTVRTRAPGSGGQGTDWEQVIGLTMNGSDVYPTLDRTSYEKGWCNQSVSQGLGVFCRSSGQTNAETLHDQSPTLTTNRDMAPFINASQPISFGAQMSNPQTDVDMVQTDVDMVQTLQAKNPMAVAQPISYGIPGNWIGRQPENGGNSTQFMEEVAPCLTGADKHGVAQPVAPTLTASNDPSRSPQSTEITNQVAAVHAASMAVRRLTPVECERLQGFPDNYTNIPWRKQPESPDGPRYKALGNSMAVPVMHWIGRRISVYEDVMGKT
jgi:DNA (cytosine-5)-methyltransferase 1